MSKKTYLIDANYYTGTNAQVQFPEGKSWEDVEDWYVKYDTLYVWFKKKGGPKTGSGDKADLQVDLNSNLEDITDWKRPLAVTVYLVSEEGEVDWETEVALCE